MSVLEVIVGVILLVFALKGLKEGLILTVCSFAILFLAVAITQIVTPQVSSFVRQNGNAVEFLSEQVNNVLFQADTDTTQSAKNDSDTIEGLCIPSVIKEQLISNNAEKTYSTLGVSNLEDYVSLYLAYSIINSITYIIVFVIVLSLLKIVMHALNIVSKLPVINTLNKLGGFVIGIAEGLMIVWVGFVFITMFSSTDFGVQLYEQINESAWLSILYNNNLIMNAILYVTKGVF